ncbi:hypothetical protein MMC29_004062 [Sticta canariensis]|nr:hypothetical protein [Sticta canariensis]
MAALKPPENPLAVLPAMLGLVLVRTGKFFQNASSHDPKHLVYTKESITQVVTAANRRFHEALDEVEIEIIRAKAVMERDLALIRSKRAERERAAGALKARSPDIDLENTSTDQPGAAGEAPPSVEESDKPKPGDAIMIDIPAAENQDLVNLESTSKNSTSEKIIPASQDIPRNAENSKGLAISIDPHSEKGVSLSNGGTKEQNGDDLLEERPETPTTANLFETMFNDTETASGNDTMSFDLNFSADPSSFQNVTMTNEFNSTSSKNINTLPGLESYVNPGVDFPMVDVAPAMTLPESNPKANAATVATSAPTGFGSAQIESSFDDLFPSNGFIEGSGDYDMTGEGISDLADYDDWFKPDV